METVPSLQQELSARTADQTTLDLRNITEIDSAGISFLIYLKRLSQDASSDLRLVNAPNQVKSMFKVSGLEELLDDAAE